MMDNFELNKIAAAILFSSLTIMIISNIADVLYNPVDHVVAEDQKVEVVGTATAQRDITLDIATLMEGASVEKGKIAVKKCMACHSFERGGINKAGPNLWGILGDKKARLRESFSYSKSMLEKGGIWGYEELFQLLKSPKSYINGTRMAFAGISNPQEIADVVSYLRSMSDDPMPLPKKPNDSFYNEENKEEQRVK